jgi:O-antigen ligase
VDRFLDATEFAGVVLLLAALSHSEAFKSAGIILAAASLVVRLAAGYRPRWLGRPAVWAAALVVGTGALSIALAEPGFRRPGELISLATMVVFFPLCIDVCTSRRRLSALVGALFVGTAAGIAVSWLTPALREGRFALPSLPNPIVSGEYLAGVLPLVAAFTMSSDRRTAARILVGLLLGAVVISLWLTVSRGPLAAAAVGLALVLFLRTRRGWVALLVLLPAAVLALALSVATPSSRLVGDRLEHAIRIRSDIWQQTGERIRERPLIGHGPGTFAELRVEVTDGAGERYTSHAHSVGLHLLAERGILGLAAFVLFCVLALRDVIGAMRREGRGIVFPAAACLAGAVVLLTAGLSHLTVWAEPGILFYAMLGIGTCGLRPGAKP